MLCRERVNRLLLAFADELKEVTEMTQGNIAAIVGLKNVCRLPLNCKRFILWYVDLHGRCVSSFY